MEEKNKNQIAVFGGGCFWCTEALFKMLKGVSKVTPGYAGGFRENPSYEEVSTGLTGHAEVVKVEFDPEKISFEDLLTVFFATHDPTTLNRQGSDVGIQYRSIILYANEGQKKEAGNFIEKLDTTGPKVVTQIEPLGKFYEAEGYHHRYFEKNRGAPYCTMVISPKLEKLEKRFKELLK